MYARERGLGEGRDVGACSLLSRCVLTCFLLVNVAIPGGVR